MLRVIYLLGFLAVITLMMVGLPAVAQTNGPTDPTAAADDIKYFDFFVVKGGYIGFGLIALSIVTIALTIEHCLTIRRLTMVPPMVAEQTRQLIDKKEYLEAIKFTAEDPSMVGQVLNAGLIEASNGYSAMQRALEETLDEHSARLFRQNRIRQHHRECLADDRRFSGPSPV